MGKPLKDETGAVYGEWKVLGRSGHNIGTAAAWHVACSCGTRTVVSGGSLRTGKSTRCQRCSSGGNLATHSMSKTLVYKAWLGMHRRCSDPSRPDYKNYGGRGITVCKRWRAFELFLADMGERPPGRSLERKKNSLGYSKSNCVWATRAEQNRNRRDSVKVRFQGETLNLVDWAQRLGFSPQTLYARYSRGFKEPRLLFSKESLLWTRRKRGETPEAHAIRILGE